MQEKKLFKIFMILMTLLFVGVIYSYQKDYNYKIEGYENFISENTYVMSKYYDELFKRAEIELEDYYNGNKNHTEDVYILKDYNIGKYYGIGDLKNKSTKLFLDKIDNKYKLIIQKNIFENNVYVNSISASIDLEKIDFDRDTSTSDIRYEYMIDLDSNIIMHDKRELIGMNLSKIQDQYIENLGMTPKQIEALPYIWNEIKNGENSGKLEYEGPNGYVIGNYRKLENVDAYIISVFDQKDFFRYTFKSLIESTIFLILGVVAIILGLFIYIINIYNIDNMTGFYNERYIERYFRKHRKKSNEDIFFIILNIDSINNQNGQSISDMEIYGVFAKYIKKSFKFKSKIGRISHEKFIFILEDSSEENVTKANMELKKILKFGFELNQENIKPIGTSFVINIVPDKCCEHVIENILKYSQLNGFIENKKNLDYQEIQDFLEDTMQKRDIILQAMKEDRIVPFYQPIYDSSIEKVLKYEVLMRIYQDGQYLAPFPFIKVAEKFGIINRLDEMVMKKAIAYKNKLSKSGKKICLSLNLSARDINVDFIGRIVNEIKSYGLEFKDFTFEITETAALEDLDSIVDIVDMIRKIGFKVSIDDFGTGFSNINHLKKLSVDYIKIDGIFIKDLERDPKSRYIVKAFKDMASAFEVDIIAEFVENQEIIEILKIMEIEKLQGYHIGRPQKEII